MKTVKYSLEDQHDNRLIGAKVERSIKRAAAVATKLGFDPAIRFVTFSGGRVGFTAGKPHEIKSLQAACRKQGMKMTKSLHNA